MKRILFGTIASLMLSVPAFANGSLTTPSGNDTSYEIQKMEETTTPDGSETRRTFEAEKMEEGSVKSKEEMQKQEENLRKDLDKKDKSIEEQEEKKVDEETTY